MKDPLISVIMAVYNGEKYINEALCSIVNQSYQNIEVIVIDDGSTDKTADIIKSFSFPIIYHYQPNKGLANAQNTGIQMAKGDYFSFLDADDSWILDKTLLQLNTLNNNPDYDMVFGYTQQFHSPELPDAFKEKIHCPKKPMPGLSANAMLIKRESFLRVGLFDTKWRKGPFVDWYARSQETNLNYHVLPQIVFKRRLHDSNLGLQRNYYIDYVRILKSSSPIIWTK